MIDSTDIKSEKRSLLASEKGGALIIALLAVVMLMLMGLTLLQVLRSGLIQASSSEASVQAEILAQNGLDEALVYIQSIVDKANKNPNLSYLARADIVKKGLEFESTSYSRAKTAKGSYEFTIDKGSGDGLDLEKSQRISDPNKLLSAPHPDIPYVHRIVVRAKGISNVKTARTVVKQMTVYVSSINPVFRYPVSSEKNLSLNGAPYILGDVLVRDQLKTSEIANFIITRNSKYNMKTDWPAIKGFIRMPPQLDQPIFSKKAVPYLDSGLTLDEDIIIGNIDCGSDLNSETCKSAYVNKGIHDGETLPKDYLQSELFGESMLGSKQVVEMTPGVIAEPITEIPASAYDHSVNVAGQLTVSGNLIIDGGLLSMVPTVDQPAIKIKNNGSIFVRNTVLPDHELIVADLAGTIELEHSADTRAFMAVVGDVNLNNFSLMGGNLFVRGNVTVFGKLRMNGTLFVDGTVDFKEISSINSDEEDSPLIVIASGKITLADHRKMENQNAGCDNDKIKNENCLRAFLYSKDNMDLYGVLSNQVIKGGIHGRNVELNAVRGDVIQTNTDASFSDQMVTKAGQKALEGQYYFKTAQIEGQLQASRLQLLYDNRLYTNPPSGIPIITGVMDVFVKEIKTLPAGTY